MLTVAVLAAYILRVAQPVAAECERDRLRSVGVIATVLESSMPKPSQRWADAWATAMVNDPLFPRDPKTEVSHGLVWSYGESLYNDRATSGIDGGASGCSFGVWASFHHVTVDQLRDDPVLCINIARRVMRYSFAMNPDVPMAQYSGSATHPKAIAIAKRRSELVKKIAAMLPAIDGGAT